MQMITLEVRDHVAVASMVAGVTNPLSRQLVDELAEVVDRVTQDSAVRGFVLRSSNDKFFSIGFNIPELFELGEDAFAAFYRGFNQVCLNLYRLPKPTVAALSGHAIAGGRSGHSSCSDTGSPARSGWAGWDRQSDRRWAAGWCSDPS